jgi:hypothetical protein
MSMLKTEIISSKIRKMDVIHYHVKQNKPDSEKQISHVLSYVDLKKGHECKKGFGGIKKERRKKKRKCDVVVNMSKVHFMHV